MARIAFYISSHGFGHATREIEVINRLPESVDVEIITAVPQWLFENSIQRQFDFVDLSHDIGLIQIDSITPDIPKTLQSWQDLLQNYPAMAKKEAARLCQSNTSLVVGDVSPFSVAVAKEAGLQSIIIANFSWDWIFQPLIKYNSEFSKVIEEISNYYRQCDLLLRSPLCGDLSVFPKVQDIPLIVRTAKNKRETVRKQYAIEKDRLVYLLTFGGNQYPLPKHAFQEHNDIQFISFDENLSGIENVTILNAQTVYHPDIVNMCDGVITKLGYGVVTECIAHGVPVAYPPRADFPEFEVIERETKHYIPMTRFDESDLKNGDWRFLEQLRTHAGFSTDYDIKKELLSGGQRVSEMLQNLIR